ncbi:Uncharacterised protein [Yokenella regensburgei]|nr:Uncharacterised protein [Yokenella regensburgei]
MGQKLAGYLERFVNRDSFVDVDSAISFLWRVVELHQRGVTGPRIIPAVRTLLCHAVHLFNHGD